MASINCAKTSARRDENHLSFVIWCVLYWRFYGMHRCPRHALAGRPGMWQGCCLSHVCVPQGRIPSPGRHSPGHWHQFWGISGSISSLLIDDLTLVIENRTPTISPEQIPRRQRKCMYAPRIARRLSQPHHRQRATGNAILSAVFKIKLSYSFHIFILFYSFIHHILYFSQNSTIHYRQASV